MEDPNLRTRQTGLDFDYLKSVPGLLKILEIFGLLLAFACLSGFTLNYTDPRYGGRFDFFYFATVTSWLVVIFLFVFFMLRLHERIAINWNLFMAVYSPVTAFLLLLASSLVLDTAVHFRRSEQPDKEGMYFMVCKLEPCGNVEAAGAFGIITMVLFAVDTVMFCLKNRNTSAAEQPASFEGENNDNGEPVESTGAQY